MSFATYDEARPWARAMREEALERRMPPSGLRSGAALYENARTLSFAELELLVSWVDGGAPRGEPLDPPPSAPATHWSATIEGERVERDGARTGGRVRFAAPQRWIGEWALEPGAWPVRSAVLSTPGGEILGRWTVGDPPVRYPPGAGVRPSRKDGLVADFAMAAGVAQETLRASTPRLHVNWASHVTTPVVGRAVTAPWSPGRSGATVLALRLELPDPAASADVTVARADGRRDFLMAMAPPGVPDPISYRLREPLVLKPGDRLEVDATSPFVLDIEELASTSRAPRAR